MPGRVEWVLLAYRMPREPSTRRITVWRKLRRLGVAQVGDGLVALPADARTREQLEWVADDVLAAAGEATVWLARLGSAGQERALVERMAESVAGEYRRVVEEARSALAEHPAARRRTLRRLRRAVHSIGQRDFFPPPERDEARRAIEAVADQVAAEVAP